MANDRFVEVYSQGVLNVAKILVDTETGVNYLMGSHDLRVGTGLTVLVDQDGKPVVTPVN
ncbi:xylan 1,4-beta-xylosidase [bacterium C-53]|nr:xylan 1,4-beta-xylosidase [Lachnospiraceae bacterium]NBI02366.1 xylan 1,4-beta-xylosidase [Lachnospiraceae bacterium]RKJ11919.1 xylan 1,4-beta-xylosidase [bacterium C-53]